MTESTGSLSGNDWGAGAGHTSDGTAWWGHVRQPWGSGCFLVWDGGDISGQCSGTLPGNTMLYQLRTVSGLPSPLEGVRPWSRNHSEEATQGEMAENTRQSPTQAVTIPTHGMSAKVVQNPTR